MNVFAKVGIDLQEPVQKTAYPSDIDTDAALLEASAAYESVIEYSFNLSLLQNAYEAIEESLELDAELIAKDKFTPEVAQVGYEAFAANLKILGVEPEAIGVAGFESAEDAGEAKKGFLAKAWEAIKTAAKKLWEAVVKFVEKIVDFIMGLFGKRGRTADQLKDLLNKLKEAGKTELPKDAKFEEKTQELLAKNIGIYCVLAGNKCDAASLVNTVGSLSKFVEDALKKFKEAKADFTSLIKDFGEAENSVKEILKIVESTNKSDLPKELEPFVKFHLAEGEVQKMTVLTYVAGNACKVATAVINEKVLEEAKKLESEGKHQEALNKLADVASIKTMEVEITPELAKKLVGNIKPIRFEEAEKIAEAIDKASKGIDKEVQNVKKDVKDIQKTLDKAIKEADKKEAGKVVVKFISKYIIALLREIASGAVRTSATIIKNRAAMLVVESSKLWVKPGEEGKKEEAKEEK